MRRLIALILAGALALALCGCNGEETAQPSAALSAEPTPSQAAAERPFALSYDPDESLHPITGTSRVNLDLASLVYEGLFELDNTFTAHPVLAQEAVASEDGLSWTITVKNGVRFSDGTPLTADHVAASLTAARTSALYAQRLSTVTAVEAGEGAVTVYLSRPNGAFPALLDIPVVLEREEGLPLGTGRYCFSTEGDGLTLRLNGNHDGTLPYDSIPLRAVTTADQRIAAFDSGEVSAVLTDFSSPYALGYSSSYETCDYPTTGMIYVGFRAGEGPCRSDLVRRAFSMAFDRDSVARSLLSGHGDAAALPISPLHGEYSADAAALLDYDVQGAAELLAEAGYTKGEDGLLYQGKNALAVTLLVNSDSAAKQSIADFLARSLTGLGVTVTVTKLRWEEYVAALERGQFDLYIGETTLTADFDPGELLTGSLNYGGYASETVPQLLAEWRAAQGSERTQAACRLWDALAREAPIAPLCFKRGSLLMRWGVASDLQPTRGDPFYGMDRWKLAG